jgi:hypothetical protein
LGQFGASPYIPAFFCIAVGPAVAVALFGADALAVAGVSALTALPTAVDVDVFPTFLASLLLLASLLSLAILLLFAYLLLPGVPAVACHTCCC